MEDRDRDVKTKLDEVVGTQFDSITPTGALRNRLLKWILGALAAVSAAWLVVAVIESHRLPPESQRAGTKPVPVHILPESNRR